MNFNSHSHLKGMHAFLSASKYHWINYEPEQLDQTYLRHQAARRGDQFHQLAADLITMGVKLPYSKQTLNMYVNDAIGYGMTPEQTLFYSVNAFGTADAIKFDEEKQLLRIHDLKTGVTKTSIKQLLVYAAFFCLEYGPERGFRPMDINFELRIYQNDEVLKLKNEDDGVVEGEIVRIMNLIQAYDKRINELKLAAL